MTNPQKQKGSIFEREIANFLTKTYNESFIRAPGSGAYVGGKNQSRKEFLHEGQIRSFKGDIVPGESFINFNAECKSYKEFPFHQVLTGECKLLDSWISQMLSVGEPNDLNILFIKINRKGKFVCVQSKFTWISDQFLYYTSKDYNDWIIFEFEHFFKLNKDLLKTYSGTPVNQLGSLDTKSDSSILNLSTQSLI
jgi:hypothetical protein